jgi:uncharacterized membrane protein YgcG
MSIEKEIPKYRISAFSDFSALSAVLIVVVIIATLFSLALYIWMAVPPGKVYRLDDQAGIFSETERDELLSLMKSIRRDKDINVMVVTVTDKGSDYQKQDESESIRYAQDRFKELSRFEKLRDNSGVLIFLELDGDYRFFYIVTFGTAKASITNSECDAIYKRQLSSLTSGDYQQAVQKSLVEISKHNFTSVLLILTYVTFIIAPFLIVIPIIRLIARKKRSQITVNAATYLDKDAPNMIKKTDIFSSMESSNDSFSDDDSEDWGGSALWIILRILMLFLGGGGGGRRGGGGGRRGGGGGGGRFGGGGGRF